MLFVFFVYVTTTTNDYRFPRWRNVMDVESPTAIDIHSSSSSSSDMLIYDPAFVLPLLSFALTTLPVRHLHRIVRFHVTSLIAFDFSS